ncbi:MAG TPA: ATP-binding cassette domain-containing protein [Planctomycetota bacterium]|nr:ATP-binding cassette domain-containing protein [Planctomycetota bacterium]
MPSSERGEPRIVARGLARSFRGRPAVLPFDLDLGPGITGLLGPNGSGKSTFLRMLVGLVRPDAGQAEVAGVPVTGDGTRARRRSTYAPGEIALYGEMRGRDHLDWLLRGREREARERARTLGGELGLPLERRVRGYSHGMKRQLLFAAAMAPRVAVRILDEASEGLDPSRRSLLLELLREDAARGTAILLSSHHLAEVDRACDTFVFLDAGRKIGVEGAAARRAARALGPLAQARASAGHVVLELAEPDPRPALAALARADDLPAPRTLAYGEPSLQELYGDLYGVEPC